MVFHNPLKGAVINISENRLGGRAFGDVYSATMKRGKSSAVRKVAVKLFKYELSDSDAMDRQRLILKIRGRKIPAVRTTMAKLIQVGPGAYESWSGEKHTLQEWENAKWAQVSELESQDGSSTLIPVAKRGVPQDEAEGYLDVVSRLVNEGIHPAEDAIHYSETRRQYIIADWDMLKPIKDIPETARALVRHVQIIRPGEDGPKGVNRFGIRLHDALVDEQIQRAFRIRLLKENLNEKKRI